MKLLTKNTDYAVRTLTCLAQNKDDCLSSAEIAKQEGIPLYFLRRILRTLIDNSLVEAREGVNGGVVLSVNPNRVTVYEVIRLLQGEIQIAECMFRGKVCENRGNCVLRKKIAKIEDQVSRDFKKITIWSLVNQKKGKRRAKKNNKNRRR